jgi:glucose-6-phosphate 1-dehydrogenase
MDFMPDVLAAPLDREQPLSVVVIGASGDLALKKIIPALFALYSQNLLPKTFHVIGYARSALDAESFRGKVTEHLTCRYVPGEKCAEKMTEFLGRCHYVAGKYDAPEDFRRLDGELARIEGGGAGNRMFYLSIPPFLFLDVARTIKEAGLAEEGAGGPWRRVVVEKPFGSDRATSDALTAGMSRVFSEDQVYRIDHYLGKEVIQNLMVLRFANLILDPIWSRTYIHNVRISWMEDLGLEGRAGYFNEYGIIRDVMQNHLLQMLALVAMEQPVGLHANHIRDEKVKVLRCIPPLPLSDLVIGQFAGGMLNGVRHPGYLEDPDVPPDSITPTYAAAVLHVRNRRWDGVPFLIRAGKGLNARMTEIRIQFHDVPGNIFAETAGHLNPNELVIRIQPDAAISFRIVNKVPGLSIVLGESELDLRYESAFNAKIPDAYEWLLLDVVRGDKSLFIRSDELEAAWDIFTPVLHKLDAKHIQPVPYPFGTAGPKAADLLASRHAAAW